MERLKHSESTNKPCQVLYNISEADKPALFAAFKSKNYDFFSEEGNLLVVWGDREREQLKTLGKNKIIIDQVLGAEGFNPTNVHPKIVEQLNLLKDLTTKCK